MISAGQAGHSPMFVQLKTQLRVERDSGRPRTRPDAEGADRSYSCRAIRSHLRPRRIKAAIPKPDDQKGRRKLRGPRVGRPVAFDTADCS